MKTTPKFVLLFTYVLLCTTQTFSQSLSDFFKDNTVPLTYLGIDYTKNLIINDDAKTAEITGKWYNAMNELVVNEQESKNYDVGQAFGRKKAAIIDINAVTANNKNIDPNTILSSKKKDFKRLNQTDIKNAVAALPLENKEGIGLVFIMEGMKKYGGKGYGALWITLINMKTKEVLMTERDEHEADGFSFRNYWVSVIRRTIMEIDWTKYKDWKKQYGR